MDQQIIQRKIVQKQFGLLTGREQLLHNAIDILRGKQLFQRIFRIEKAVGVAHGKTADHFATVLLAATQIELVFLRFDAQVVFFGNLFYLWDDGTGIGAYMMCMNFQTVDGGSLVSMNKFGAGGMFTAMVVGLMVAVIYKLLAKYSFFGEDSVIPDFVKNWFDNIAAILISLTVAYLFTYVAKIDVFAMVQILMKPVTSFAQSAPGVIMIVFLQNVFYFFGVSGWVFTPVTRSITQAAIAENRDGQG